MIHRDRHELIPKALRLQLLDRLEQQYSSNRSPSLGAFSQQSLPESNLQQSPAAAFQQLQYMMQQNAQGQGQSMMQPQQQYSNVGPSQMQQSQQSQPQTNQQQNAGYQNFNQGQQYGQNQTFHPMMSQQPTFPGHQRTASFSSTSSSNALQPTPNQTFAQIPGPGSSTPTLPAQTPQTQNGKLPPTGPPVSPNRSPPVWSGPIQWSLVDPQTKQKRELAFYVDAIPMRSNAAVEL